jgi:Trypsin-like peptidase domain/Effector-associated domain 1
VDLSRLHSEDDVMLTGPQFEATRRALLDAFTRDEFEGLLRNDVGVEPRLLVPPGAAFEQAVFDVLDTAERIGWTRDLVQAAYRARPGRLDLAALFHDLGLTPPAVQDLAARHAEVLEQSVNTPRSFYSDLWREQLAAIERQVCRVEVDGAPVGTGFLVGADAVLTCYHVVQAVLAGERPPSAVWFRFDYRARPDGAATEGMVVGLHSGDWRMDASPYSRGELREDSSPSEPTPDELDHALLRLDRPIGAEKPFASGPTRGWVRIPTVDPPIRPGDPLAIVQHAGGGPLRLALDTHAVLGFNSNRTRLRYTTETEPGSAGAPCFDATWNLVAMHHRAEWRGGAGAYNEGVPVAVIRDRLHRLGMAGVLGGDAPAVAARSGSTTARESRPPEPGPVINPDDLQKDRWGGLPERNGRRVRAELLGTEGRQFTFNVVAESTDGTRLEGPVLFHLHDTYPQPLIRITKVREGARAVLEEVTAYGVFTIGVQVKNARGEWVGLEYCLTELPGLASWFLER